MIFFVWLIMCYMTAFASVLILANYHSYTCWGIKGIWPISPRKCLTTAKNKKGVFTDWYTAGIVKNSGMWLVYDCSGIQMVCESHKHDLNWKFWYTNWYMWKSGIRVVCEQKEPYKIIYQPFFVAVEEK